MNEHTRNQLTAALDRANRTLEGVHPRESAALDRFRRDERMDHTPRDRSWYETRERIRCIEMLRELAKRHGVHGRDSLFGPGIGDLCLDAAEHMQSMLDEIKEKS